MSGPDADGTPRGRVLIITRWPSVEAVTQGTPYTTTWAQLCDLAQAPSPLPPGGKGALELWNAGDFQGAYRAGALLNGAYALIIDYDSHTMAEDGHEDGSPELSLLELCGCFRGWAHIIHTTPSHRPGRARWRVLLLLSRPVDEVEYTRLALWATEHAATHGAPGADADTSWHSAAQCFYVPAHGPHYEHACERDGTTLDVDAILAQVPEITGPAPRGESLPDDFGGEVETTPWGRAVMQRCARTVAVARVERHNVLLRQSRTGGRCIAGMQLNRAELVEAMEAACEENGYAQDEPADMERAIRDGIRHGLKSPLMPDPNPKWTPVIARSSSVSNQRRYPHPKQRRFDRVRVYRAEALDSGRYLPLHDVDLRVTYVRAPKGSNKTGLGRFLLDQRRGRGLLVAVTHRRSLARNLADRLNLANYQDLPGGPISEDAVICLDSLHRLDLVEAGHKPSLRRVSMVFIDEVEQVVRHLYGGTMKGHESVRAHSKLVELIRLADRVVVADADLSVLAVDFVRRALGGDGSEEGPTAWGEEFREARFLSPWRYLMSRSQKRIEAAILEEFKAGARIAVACFSARQATRLARMLEKVSTDARVGLVTRRTAIELADELGDINAYAAGLDAIVYSPTLGTGVSIDVVDHFDRIFGLFCFGVGTVTDAHQMLHRVRSPRSSEILIWVAPQCSNREKEPRQIRSQLLELRERSIRVVDAQRRKRPTAFYAVGRVNVTSDGPRLLPLDAEHFDTYVDVLAHERTLGGPGGAPYWAFRRYLNGASTEAPWVDLDADDVPTLLTNDTEERDGLHRQAKRQLEEERAQAIVSAPVIHHAKALTIREPKSTQQADSVERAHILHFYGRIDAESVLADKRGRLRKQARRFCDLRALAEGHADMLARSDLWDLETGSASHCKHRLERAQMMADILVWYGIPALEPGAAVDNQQLRVAVHMIGSMKARLKTLDFTVRRDYEDNPVPFLSDALRQLGLKFARKRPGANARREYRICPAQYAWMDEMASHYYRRMIEGKRHQEALVARAARDPSATSPV